MYRFYLNIADRLLPLIAIVRARIGTILVSGSVYLWDVESMVGCSGENERRRWRRSLRRGSEPLWLSTRTRGHTYGAEAESDFNDHGVHFCRGEDYQRSAEVLSTLIDDVTET